MTVDKFHRVGCNPINNKTGGIKLDKRKRAIMLLLMEVRGITADEALDILRETQYVVNDTLAGETDYKTPAEVVSDYLGLGEEYTCIFTD